MRINNNLLAVNAHRQLMMNNDATAKTLEKLSSGYRINRAGDDAVGLAISEKMRSQIRGLTMASKNAQDGISLIQTAEGALNETHAILQRMRELAVYSANDTNTAVDREELQKEINQLIEEVDRIATTTEFNTKSLLNGGAGIQATVTDDSGDVLALGQQVHVVSGSGGVKAGAEIDLTAVKAATTGTITIATHADDEDVQIGTSDVALKINGHTINIAAGTVGQDIADVINQVSEQTGVIASYTAGDTSTKGELKLETVGSGSANSISFTNVTLSATAAEGDTFNATAASGVGNVVVTINDSATPAVAQDAALASSTILNATGNDAAAETTAEGVSISSAGNLITLHGGDVDGLILRVDSTKEEGDVKVSIDANNALNMQIGANAGQTMSISVGDMRAAAIGITNVDISTAATASDAIGTLQTAIELISTERSALGAFQNRLEHTIKNLDTAAENLQASESRIRDVDMAREMVEFTKQNILQQAATAMLAQANMAPQQVLQLLR